MSSSPTAAAAAAAAAVQGGATALTTAIHHDIIEKHILSKLDAPTLLTAGCVSSQLKNLCRRENLWRNICISTWPSLNNPRLTAIISNFPSGHRSFFSDSFPTLHHHHHKGSQRQSPELISAVDIQYQNNPVYSKVKSINTLSDSFLDAPFLVDLLSNGETVKLPGNFENDDLSRLAKDMTLSWILIDSSGRMAANLSSMRPVLVRRHWVTGDIKIRYVRILAGGRKGKSSEFVQCKIEVDCARKEGGELHVGQVNLKIEDLDRKCLSGKRSLVILQDALEGGERKKGKCGEEKEMYEKYLAVRNERRERLQRFGRRIDIVDRATRISISLAMLFLLFGSLLGKSEISNLSV